MKGYQIVLLMLITVKDVVLTQQLIEKNKIKGGKG